MAVEVAQNLTLAKGASPPLQFTQQLRNNYMGITKMSHFMKLWERIIEARLREIVNIRDN